MQDSSSVCVSTAEFDDAVTAEKVSSDLQTEDFLFSLSTECVKGVRSVVIIHIFTSFNFYERSLLLICRTTYQLTNLIARASSFFSDLLMFLAFFSVLLTCIF